MKNEDKEREIEKFYYREANLLDSGKFYEWLELFTEDARYVMPSRQTHEPGQGAEVSGEGELGLIEDDKGFLAMRVKRLGTGLAHAEQPPSRTRHFVTNVVVLAERDDEYEVSANVLVFQSRYEKSEDFFVGTRRDLLRKVGGSWRIARRQVILDQPTLPRVLSIFF
jgi:dibenzofuran dioxygenase beta subunit